MKHKLFSKRGLALVVSVMMCLSAMSTTAWAGNFKELQAQITEAEKGDGNVTLTDNYTYGEGETQDNTTITIKGNVNLNLNGYTISGKGESGNSNSVITVNGGGNLTLSGKGTITGGKGNSSDAGTEGGGVIVKNGGTFTMNGGTITENTATGRGGGVYVENGAEFTMNGGTITKNTTDGDGGGVAVWGGGKFTMNAGSTISDNTAGKSGGGVHTAYASGAGKGATFTMNGGEISGNGTVLNAGGGNYGGGGVFVDKGDFTMSGGKITNNTSAKETADNHTTNGASGGGVYMAGGKFTMNGGEISGNNANGIGEGGGVYGTNKADIDMEGGKITGNTANSTWGGGGVRVYDADFTMSGGELTGNKAPRTETDRISVSKDADDGKAGTATITGGVIDHNAEGYVPKSGYGMVDDYPEAGTVLVVPHDETHPYDPEHATDVSVVPATCSATGTRQFYCGVRGCNILHTEVLAVNPENHNDSDIVKDEAVPVTCTTDGKTEGSHCGACKKTVIAQIPIPATGHTRIGGAVHAPTCTEAGYTEAVTCSECHNELKARQEGDAALGHDFNGTVTRITEPTLESEGLERVQCTRCDETENRVLPRLQPGTTEPGTTEPTDPTEPGITIDDEDVPLGDAPATATIADEDVPLAGLVTLAQLLDELHRHEGAPEVHIPDGFPFADHEYAEAICWGLDNALVFHTEEEPLDPDEIVTVGLMREVLTNFVAYRGVEEFTVELAGADDEIVMDLGERLVVFYAQLAEAEAAAETDETEAA